MSEDFEAIEAAVMESARGRWFLAEYARRLRSRETAGLLEAIARLETLIAANQDLTARRLARILDPVPAVPAEEAECAVLQPRHLDYFTADEDLFEAPEASPPGEVVAIREAAETESAAGPSRDDLPPAEDQPKRRIVIIRHKPGEPIDVPLHDNLAASA
jgi:hypothetical protein